MICYTSKNSFSWIYSMLKTYSNHLYVFSMIINTIMLFTLFWFSSVSSSLLIACMCFKCHLFIIYQTQKFGMHCLSKVYKENLKFEKTLILNTLFLLLLYSVQLMRLHYTSYCTQKCILETHALFLRRPPFHFTFQF